MTKRSEAPPKPRSRRPQRPRRTIRLPKNPEPSGRLETVFNERVRHGLVFHAIKEGYVFRSRFRRSSGGSRRSRVPTGIPAVRIRIRYGSGPSSVFVDHRAVRMRMRLHVIVLQVPRGSRSGRIHGRSAFVDSPNEPSVRRSVFAPPGRTGSQIERHYGSGWHA